jgi:tRNA (adenine58-N1)-methyltransferase non-catalytic subunit
MADQTAGAAAAPCGGADAAQHVQPRDWVVIEASDGKRVLGRMLPTATARIAKHKRAIYAMVGCRWGDVFTLAAGDGLVRVDDVADAVAKGGGGSGVVGAFGAGVDNRDVVDLSCNQALDQAAIEGLKRSGVSGEEMVRTVAGGSRTFQAKTVFAQDKYVKRKLQKYDVRVRVVRPTALSICETYFSKNPEKVLCMRPDALALLLGFSGVRAGVRALVYETCTGVVAAAVAERMAGFGVLLNVFTGGSPTGIEVLRMMNVAEAVYDAVVPVPVEILGKVDVEEPEDAEYLRYSRDEPRPDAEEHEPGADRKGALARRPRRGELKRVLREQVDVLVVATRGDLIPVVDVLLKHLAPGGTFAVYSAFLHPLAELQFALQLSRMAVRVELMESSLVTHQVLPGRTHPLMSDSATGGYVLWGVRIAVAPPL